MTQKGNERTRKIKILTIPTEIKEKVNQGKEGDFTTYKQGIKVEVIAGDQGDYLNIQEYSKEKAEEQSLSLIEGNTYQVMEKCTGEKEGTTYWKLLSSCNLNEETIDSEPEYMKPKEVPMDANSNLHKVHELKGSEAKFQENGARDGMIFNNAVQLELFDMKRDKRKYSSTQLMVKVKELTVSYIEAKQTIKEILIGIE